VVLCRGRATGKRRTHDQDDHKTTRTQNGRRRDTHDSLLDTGGVCRQFSALSERIRSGEASVVRQVDPARVGGRSSHARAASASRSRTPRASVVSTRLRPGTRPCRRRRRRHGRHAAQATIRSGRPDLLPGHGTAPVGRPRGRDDRLPRRTAHMRPRRPPDRARWRQARRQQSGSARDRHSIHATDARLPHRGRSPLYRLPRLASRQPARAHASCRSPTAPRACS